MTTTIQKREKSKNGPAHLTREERGYVLPETDIVETKDGFEVSVEMPDVNKEGLEITLENNVLTLIGHRQNETTEGLTPLFRESKGLDYRRVFELAPSIDVNKVDAKITNGLLRLHLAKTERVKPRKITVHG